jgi:4-amino-4-deoxy-L-arabinose transferase-like glycosyltransferase
LLWHLGYAPLWNPDEGRYASASLEMAQPFAGGSGDWIVPHLNGVPRLNKPPLVYWTTATFLKTFGASAAVARLASALAAVGVLLVLWQLGRRMFDERTGVLAAVIWATCTLPFILGHTLNTDMQLTFCMALSLLGLWRLRADCCPAAILIAGVGLGLALLAKGPVGVVLPGGVWILWLLLSDRKKVLSHFPFGGTALALVVATVIGVPWYLAIARVHPEFLYNFLLGENIARLTGSKLYHKPEPPYFYLPIILIGLFPWTVLLVPSVAKMVQKASNDDGAKRHLWLLWIWAAAVVLLFSISHVKLITYILPAFPAFALIMAQALTSRKEGAESRLWRTARFGSGALLLVLAVALPIAFFGRKGISHKLIPASEIAPIVWGLCVVAVITGVALFVNRTSLARTIAIGSALLLTTLLLGAERAARYEDVSSMTIALQPLLQPGDKFVSFKTFDPTAIFYLHRTVPSIDVANRSGWDEKLFASSPQFPSDHTVLKEMIAAANRSGNRVYVLTRWKYAHWPVLKGLQVIGMNNDYRLLSNGPAPAGFVFEAIAPKMRKRPLSDECKALSPLC